MLARVTKKGDDGAALVLAIIFVLIVAVVATAVVDLTGTSILGGTAIAKNRQATYALDAAVDGAVRQVRTRLAAPANQGIATGYGGSCDDYLAPVTNSAAVTVSCAGEQGVSGQYDSGGIVPAVNPNNVPPVALQAYANTGEPGIVLDANGNYRIHGSVESTSTIRACTNSGGNSCSSGTASAGLLVEGTVKAPQCIGDIRTFGPPYPTMPGDPAAPADPSLKQCPGGVASPDPQYAPDTSALTPARTVPACPAGWLVTFSPGTYTNLTGLNALTNGGCPGKVLWFQPGTYLFKFAPATPAAWTLGDASVDVVGGWPFGWSATDTTRPPLLKPDNANPARHSCVTQFDALPLGATASTLGVSFAFTGESRLKVLTAGGNLELCAQPSDTNQQIALYGMPNRSNEQSGTLGATAASGTGAWTDLATAGKTIDGLEASGSTTPGGTISAAFSGFDQLSSSALPSGAVVTKVELKVAHSETSSNGTIGSVNAGVTAADGTVVNVPSLSTCTSGACVDTLDLTGQLGTVGKLRNGAGSGPSLSFSLTANSGKVATEALDGLALDVFWVPVAMVATSAVGSPSASVATPTVATVIDGNAATMTVAANSTTTVSLGGYQMSSADLPAGAVIKSVKARIAHKDTNTAYIQNIKLSGTAADGSTFANVAATECSASLGECTEMVDLTSYLGTVGKLRSGASGVSLAYAVSTKNTGAATSLLDGIRLEVTFAPDGLGSAEGCMLEAPYNPKDAATCAVLSAQGTNAFIALHGTIYAPSSAVDLKVVNGGTTVFGRGALVRTLRLFFNPSVVYNGANVTIETPDGTAFTRHDRIVDFWACSPTSTGARTSPCNDTNANLHVVVSMRDTVVGSPLTYKVWSYRKS